MKNISEERMQILKMIEEGKITASEALELINALEQTAENSVATVSSKQPKWLKVRVKTMDDRVKSKINLPLSLLDIGLKLGTAYAPDLKNSGLDQLDLKEIMEAVKNGAEGKIVDIEDEESQTKVEVYVE